MSYETIGVFVFCRWSWVEVTTDTSWPASAPPLSTKLCWQLCSKMSRRVTPSLWSRTHVRCIMFTMCRSWIKEQLLFFPPALLNPRPATFIEMRKRLTCEPNNPLKMCFPEFKALLYWVHLHWFVCPSLISGEENLFSHQCFVLYFSLITLFIDIERCWRELPCNYLICAPCISPVARTTTTATTTAGKTACTAYKMNVSGENTQTVTVSLVCILTVLIVLQQMSQMLLDVSV